MSVNNVNGYGGGNHGGGGSNNGSPCGACKFLRRKCVPECIFAPYFDSEQGATHFAAVHKVFGASNVSKLLLNIPVQRRLDAVITICYEAHSRLRDPVYGCVAHIFALQQQLVALQAELNYLHGQLATMELPQQAPVAPPPPPPHSAVPPPVFSIADLPAAPTAAASSMPAHLDVSSLFEPSMGQPSWAMQQRAMMDPRQYLAAAQLGPLGGGDLHTVAREFMHRHVTVAYPPAPEAQGSNAASSSQSLSSK